MGAKGEAEIQGRVSGIGRHCPHRSSPLFTALNLRNKEDVAFLQELLCCLAGYDFNEGWFQFVKIFRHAAKFIDVGVIRQKHDDRNTQADSRRNNRSFTQRDIGGDVKIRDQKYRYERRYDDSR